MREFEVEALNLLECAEKIAKMEHEEFGEIRDEAERAAMMLSQRITEYDLKKIPRER